jgi:uncharacterized protein YjiS (DUF1127 family)
MNISTLAGVNFPAFNKPSFFSRLAIKYKARAAAKATVKELSALSDKELADIGLHRGAIKGIAQEHYDEIVTNANLKGWV